MVRASSSKKQKGVPDEYQNGEPNPVATERKRLKKLAFSKNMLSETPSRSFSALSPSKTVMKHHGADILKKSHRKNKFLFSFPGLLGPVKGGKIGELKDLGTKNPVLYIDFPQGQMKLFGTIVYPKNRYLTLQFSRGGKNVMCEDYFDNMIAFSDAWWIGRKEENPEEARLDFPKELNEGQDIECNFKGGAGAESVSKQGVYKNGRKHVEQSPEAEIEDDFSNGEKKLKNVLETTPVRQSKRTSGKTYNFADVSSEDDSVKSEADMSEGEEKKNGVERDSSNVNHTAGKTCNNSRPAILDIDNDDDDAERNHFPEQVNAPPVPGTKSKQPSQSVATTKSKDDSRSDHCSLVQATISTLFKKVEEKKAPRSSRKSPSSKDSGKKLQHTDLKRRIDQAEEPKKKGKVIEEKKTGSGSKGKKKEYEVEDEIEDFSSQSQDTDGSDEDWAA